VEFDRQSIKDGLKLYDFPINVIVETSSYCNLKCPICPNPFMKRKKGNMEFKVFKKVVDEIAQVKPDTTLWLALLGEPLINHSQLIKGIRYAKDKGLKDVRLNTNGLLLNEEISRNLVDAGLDYVLISVDAYQQSTYEKIRVGGALWKLEENVQYLLSIKGKLKVVTQFIVMEENESELEEFKLSWLEAGAIVKVRPKLSWGNTIEAKNLNLEQKDRTYPCPWLMRTVSIQWTGRLAQCDFDFEGEYSPGDINKQTIKEIWDGEILKRRQKHIAGDFTHPLCSTCKDWQVGLAVYYGEKK
jgi:radical SAM protein with 4Fe4S-binding SPASM domain